MAKTSRSYDFTPGTKIFSQQVDDEFNRQVTAHNTLDDELIAHKSGTDHDSRYYTEAEIDTKVSNLQSQITSNDTDITNLQTGKANQATTYTKTEVDNSLALKANQSTTYTKTEVDNIASGKANIGSSYTKTEADGRFTNITGNHQGTWQGYTPNMVGDVVLSQRIATLEADHANQNAQAITLSRGLQAITTDQATPLWVKKIVGRTLVNLLGRDGNCEDTTKFTYTGGTAALDNTRKTNGSNSIKVTKTAADTYVFEKSFYPSVGDCFIAIADIYLENPATNIYFSYSNIGVSSSAKGVTGSAGITSKYAGVTGQFIPVIEAFEIISVTTPGTSYFRPRLKHSGTSGHLFNVDSYRLYKIPKAKYDSFTSQITLEQAQAIASEYLYVDDVKSITNPYVVASGKNLVPPFNEWTLASAATVTEPYKCSINHTAGVADVLAVKIPILPNQQYTMSIGKSSTLSGVYIDGLESDSSGVQLTDLPGADGEVTNYTFTSNSSTKYLQMRVVVEDTLATGTYTFTNPMLNLGSTALPFEPKNDDILAYDVKLASSVDGSVYDTLSYVDGKPMKEARFKEMVLDGSLGWSVSADFTGYKQVGFTLPSPSVLNANAVKYDGKVLPYNNSLNNSDQIAINSSDKVTFYVTVSDTDSGWGETYTPTADEIKAYFNGWQLLDTSGANYSGTGTKRWLAIPHKSSWNPSVEDSYNTGTVPISRVAPDFDPYRLQYQLAQSQLTEVQPLEGSVLNLHEGTNQVKLGENYNSTDYSASIISTDIEYNTNLKTVVDRNVQNITDLSERLTIVETGKANKEQMSWVDVVLLNGATNNSSTDKIRYYKDEFGVVRFAGAFKGITTAGTTIGYVSKGNKPAQPIRLSAIKTTDGTTVYLTIETSGAIVSRSTLLSTDIIALENMTYRAEQ